MASSSSSSSSSSTSTKPRFWRPGTIAPGSNVERDEKQQESDGFILPFIPPSGSGGGYSGPSSIASQRLLLPIAGHRSQILYALETHQVLIIVGETGSGKSSQLPQYLDDAGWTLGGLQIGITQPRRIAASTLAERVAMERGTKLGEIVGYAFRFESLTSPETRIKYMTDGLLLREMMQDPLLRNYSVIMLDEAHERSVSTDMLMALLRKVLRRRSDLRLVVSSATLDAEQFVKYFQGIMPDTEDQPRACILTVEGRQFPVEIFYTAQPVKDYLRAAVDTVLHIAARAAKTEGDILVFLTGREEIDRACALLGEEVTDSRGMLNLRILPLYSGISADRQADVFAPPPYGQRKVIISTNVAEASVTIDGVSYVVDCGFAKVRIYDPRTSRSILTLQPISQAAAQQRAGRGGRTKKGCCYRLYTEESFMQLPLKSEPEILRSDLSQVNLQLKSFGIDDIARFGWMDSPSISSIGRSLMMLHSMGAIDDQAHLTPIGRVMADWPIEIMQARALLESANWIQEHPTVSSHNPTTMTDVATTPNPRTVVRCSEEVLSIVAMLSVEGIFLSSPTRGKADAIRSHFAVREGDHLTLLNVYNAFMSVRHKNPSGWCHSNLLNFKSLVRAAEIRRQLRRHMIRSGLKLESSGGDSVAIRKALTAGFFRNVAQLQPDGTYRPILTQARRKYATHTAGSTDDSLHIHPTSVLYATVNSPTKPEFIIYGEVLTTNKHYMRDLSVIESSWLTEVASHFYRIESGFEEENRRHAAIVEEANRANKIAAEDTDGVVGEPNRKHRKLF